MNTKYAAHQFYSRVSKECETWQLLLNAQV